MTAVTVGFILRNATAFLEEVLSNLDLRRSALSAARCRLSSPPDQGTLHALSILSEDLDAASASAAFTAAAFTSAATGAGKSSVLTALLRAISLALRRRHAEAARSLLDLFALDPAAARSDIAPEVFEELFLPHLLPALQWFAEQRSRILSAEEKRVPKAMAVLSRMSGGQAAELRELESVYEEVMDENTRVYAEYLKEVLRSRHDVRPPELVLPGDTGAGVEHEEAVKDDTQRAEIGSTNGRFNPIWAEADQSTDFSPGQIKKGKGSYDKFPSLFPERVSPQLLFGQPSNETTDTRRNVISDSNRAFFSAANSENSSFEPELDMEEAKRTNELLLLKPKNQVHRLKITSVEPKCSSDLPMLDPVRSPGFSKQAPPKDFVCPITSHLFDDPVTLETGQTYERRAIQEWLQRGNLTCPITRQKLQSAQLPKTNYVLKRLIASWKEENGYSSSASSITRSAQNSLGINPPKRLPSPTSVITQASTDGADGDLHLAITNICTSEVLSEAEAAVLQIEQFWREAGAEAEILPALCNPDVVNGFVEILFTSVDAQVLRTMIFLLCEMASKDKHVIQTLNRADSDVECMVALFKKGLVEIVSLIYLLRPSCERLLEMNIIEDLIMAIKSREDDSSYSCLKPKTAAILLLQQVLASESKTPAASVDVLISEDVVENVIPCLEADVEEERMAAIRILVKCMEIDGNCRKLISDKAKLESILENFATINDMERFEIVRFLFELVKLERRTFNERLLQIIKDGGKFSTMHALLVYLQSALQDQSPVIAGLLLQLDILVEPRKASMYREEAIDALISCLRNPDFHNSQLLAAETIAALQGRFTPSGKPLTRAFLLKRAGTKKRGRPSMGSDQIDYVPDDFEENLIEDQAAHEWERKMAFSLVNHEFGLLFEVLAEGLKSEQREFFSACLVSASWLTYMLSTLPDTGLRGASRVCLLKHFVSILTSAKDSGDKALAMLAIKSFMQDPEGLHDLSFHIKDILKNLRELKKNYFLASEMLKHLSDGQESNMEMWTHKELAQVDCSAHGAVHSIVSFKNRIFSGHSDGAIKVWECKENLLHLIQETKEHTKAVTSLAILPSGKKLYSGSADKSVRAWSLQHGQIKCIESHEVKDQVHNLTIANSMACFIPQGAGVKVLSWNGGSKTLNSNKYVKCLALVQGKLYCGCKDSSIQEIDLATGTSCTIQTGSKKLLSKGNRIQALQVQDGLLYSASSPLDGSAVKIWNASNYSQVGFLPSNLEVRCMSISTELIYLGSKTGLVEIWAKDKLAKVDTLQMGGNCRVQCLSVLSDELLIVGTSDGRIQAWGLT
ncbi:Putative E3 ubiquitin-protein ligase LIN-1 [Apostasia shenzhenica]|uniref:RING-type E3 ubiquitin transferase n=1 Tax=Apostasia shenzhenica TaxID=1088818 RepID=A0A2I0AU42_9ASPA|nr:Putative E3 ubiquitin-protein ligase LIN-1 [Apostasia shenzhenica]